MSARTRLVLGIETSCDETAVSVVDATDDVESPTVLSDVIASQIRLHAPHGGVVPELASRQHLVDLPLVCAEALSRAGVTLEDVSGIAVTSGPGLVGALLVGVSFAKSLALATGIPFVGVHHLDGHVRAAFLRAADGTRAGHEPEEPYVALIVSGGHTSLFRVERDGFRRRYVEVARTLDDAAGEAFDKVGKLAGLGYPAGPVIDRLARVYQGDRVDFPRARIKVDGGRAVTRLGFSFSGIKTSVRQHLATTSMPQLLPGEDPATRPDLLGVLAGFQECGVAMLLSPTMHVLRTQGLRHLVAVGGVSCNTLLRSELAAACQREGVTLVIPSPRWSTDNGAMIAAAGALRLAAGDRDGLDLEADPSARLATAA